MTLQQIKYIVEISKHDSISKAASALYVTQPTISKAVKELESSLNIQIFNRNNKGVEFTKEGKELLFYAKMLLEQTESMINYFNKQDSFGKINFTISSQHYGFAVEALVNLLEEFSKEKYRLTIREGKTTDVIEEVVAGRSILGILAVTDTNKEYFEKYFYSKSLEFILLSTTKQHVFLRREHPLSGSDSLTLEELKSYPCLTYQEDDMPLYFAEKAVNVDEVEKVVYLNDRGVMNNLLSKTDGYNLGTGCITKGYTDANIMSLPLREGKRVDIGLIKRKDTFLPEEIERYVEYLKKSLGNSL